MPVPTEQELQAIWDDLRHQFDEDLLQEAFMKLFEAFAAGKEIHNPGGWVRVTCFHKVIDNQKAFKRTPVLQMPEGEPISPVWQDRRTPEAIVTAKEQLELAPKKLIDLTLLDDETTPSLRKNEQRAYYRQKLRRKVDQWPESSSEEQSGG